MLSPTRRLVTTSVGQVHLRDFASDAPGPPVLVMHINQRSSAMYLELGAALAPTRRVIAIDHPSYGMSDHVEGSPSVGDYGRWAIETLDALEVGTAVVCGEAASAVIAADVAATSPDRVEGLVLVNCPLWRDQASRSADTDDLRPARPSDHTGWPLTRTVEWVLENDPEHAPLNPSQDWMDRMNRAQMEAGRDRWQMINAMNAYDLAPTLEAITASTLLVWGERFLYASNRAEFTTRLRDVTEHVVPDGRFDLGYERPHEVASAITTFLT